MGTNMKACRICLSSKKPLCPLFRYKLSGNYAEMLTAIADVKVASNDGLPDRICQKCCVALEKAYLLKCVAERTDRQLRKKLGKMQQNAPTKKISFDSITDIKSEIGQYAIKSEPKWEMEIDLDSSNNVDTLDGKDIVIANTVIRKVDPGSEEEIKPKIQIDEPDMSWKKTNSSDYDVEYLDDDIFQDDNDEDYIPLSEISKSKFKKPKLKEIKVFKESGNKVIRRAVNKENAGKVIRRTVKVIKREGSKGKPYGGSATAITCYPITKNGVRGAPILLKRPKDATVRKTPPGFTVKPSSSFKDKVVKVVKQEKSSMKPREKLVCPVCGILTYTLGNHMSTHQEKKKYTCPDCQKAFAQKGNLIIHMKQHSGIKDFICDMCGAGFYSQKSLVRHNLIHKGERPFPCNLCNKKFIARCDLNRHLRIHSGYKPYKCPSCTMSFNAKHQLQNHERMHTGERPYTCQNQNLKRHMRSHMGDKRFSCTICNKCFVQQHHLQNHMIVHTGEKPYSCEMCKVAFSYKVNLNNHVFKVHGVNIKFKSIHTVTEEILRKEMGVANETRLAIMQITPQMSDVPTPGAHETVQNTEYN